MNTFTVGQKVTWLYWPPDARYRMMLHIDAEVVRFTAKKVVIKCQDRRGKEHIKHVNADRLHDGYSPHSVYANGYYPVSGDAPQYRRASVEVTT
jgi:hypothetical protein